MNKKIVILIIIGALTSLLAGCAKQGYPSGGPKDERPPIVLHTLPDNNAKHFSDRQFSISLDEYVVIKDATKNVIVSPPMKNAPEYVVKGKNVVVKIKDTLMENTTYCFQFNQAIADFNEGNLLPSFNYVFSTGEWIDSMSIQGSVRDALTQKMGEETVTLLAFRADNTHFDTSLLKAHPDYVTRANKNGMFKFGYMLPGSYWIAAVEDGNNDLMIDNNEKVGFITNPIEAIVDSTSNNDSITTPRRNPIHTIAMYQVNHETQRILSSGFERRGVIRIITNLPMTEPMIAWNETAPTQWLNDKRDTLRLWLTKQNTDSIELILNDPSGLQDTLRLKYKPSKNPKANTNPLIIKTAFGNNLPYWATPTLTFTNPVQLSDSNSRLISQAVMVKQNDTLLLTKASLLIDSLGLEAQMVFDSSFSLKQGEKYQFAVPQGILKDKYGIANDSLTTSTSVTQSKEYGLIRLNISIPDSMGRNNYIIQLIDDKDKVVDEQYLNESSVIEFPHLAAATVRLRAITDLNKNGQWDAGDYGKRLQPEPVSFHPKSINIRANWEVEENWTLAQ